MNTIVKVTGSNINGDGMATLGYFSDIPTAKRILKARFIKDNDWRIRAFKKGSFEKLYFEKIQLDK